MRSLRFSLLLAGVVSCGSVFALPDDTEFGDEGVAEVRYFWADGVPGALCVACRDLNEYPMDAVAFAYNGFFGEDPWLRDTAIGYPFPVVTFDLNFVIVWFENVLFDIPGLLPNLMDVKVVMQNGQILTFTILQDGADLPVGSQPKPYEGSSSGSGGGSDDDYDADGFVDDLDYDLDDPAGIVEILDPDEDGEFEDWMEEL